MAGATGRNIDNIDCFARRPFGLVGIGNEVGRAGSREKVKVDWKDVMAMAMGPIEVDQFD